MGIAIEFQLDFVMDRDQTTAVDGQVTADQRDLAAWEMAPFGTPYARSGEKGMVFTRFLAWSALHRAGRFKGSFDRFNRECVEVRDASAGDGMAEGADADPGRPDQSDAD